MSLDPIINDAGECRSDGVEKYEATIHLNVPMDGSVSDYNRRSKITSLGSLRIQLISQILFNQDGKSYNNMCLLIDSLTANRDAVIGVKLTCSYPQIHTVEKNFSVKKNEKIIVQLMKWSYDSNQRTFSAKVVVIFPYTLPVTTTSLYDHNKAIEGFSDIVFLVGEEKEEIHCNKQFMSFISPYFKNMFNGSFKEKESQVIELRELDPKAFKNVLDLAYPSIFSITEENVEGILHVADYFGFQGVLQKCDAFLTTTKCVEHPRMLYLADRFNLKMLLERCVALASTDQIIEEIVNSSFFRLLSRNTYYRVMETRFRKEKEGDAT